MVKAVALLLLFQNLEVAPYPAVEAATVTVRVADADGQPLPGVAVELESPAGARSLAGTTDAAGTLSLRAGPAGSYRYRAQVDGVALLAPHVVVPTPRRWLYAAACIPLGLALAWRHLRRRPWAGRGVSPAPSRPAP